jgi:hypothetical protein
VPVLRSGPLAAWTSAWLAGRVSIDQVVDAVTGTDRPHQVGGLVAYEPDLVPLREVLVAWRRAHAQVRFALPVAGDVRGLPGPEPFRTAALEAGEAVIGGALGIVPEVIAYEPSSAPPTVLWQAFRVDSAPADEVGVADAQYELTTAIRDSASALSSAEVTCWTKDVPPALGDARRAGEVINVPPSFPQRAVALLAQAHRLQAMLALALAHPSGGAVDRTGIAARADALRPLTTAVRRALVAGYNAGFS